MSTVPLVLLAALASQSSLPSDFSLQAASWLCLDLDSLDEAEAATFVTVQSINLETLRTTSEYESRAYGIVAKTDDGRKLDFLAIYRGIPRRQYSPELVGKRYLVALRNARDGVSAYPTINAVRYHHV